MHKLAIISTHPIQYNAPLFSLLTQRKNIEIHVFYTWGEDVIKNKFDPCFGKEIQWDIPLLSGYSYSFIKNISSDKGSHHFKGIDNPSLIEEISAYKPDAILFYGWSFKSHLAAMKYFKGKINVFFRGDSHLLNKINPFKNFLRRLVLKNVYKNVDKAFAVGKNSFEYFKWAGIKENSIITAPHAVDNSRFVCIEKDEANSLRKKLNIQQGETVYLYAGKLIPRKNISLLIKAFIKADLKNSKLIIVGNGPLENELKELAGNYESIKFLDFQNQSSMPSVYEITDVYVLPSAIDTWGLAINEAMANGCAILLSNMCGCAADLVQEGVNGYSFINNNFSDLVSKLKLMSSANIENFKLAGKSIISTFTYEAFAEKLEREVTRKY